MKSWHSPHDLFPAWSGLTAWQRLQSAGSAAQVCGWWHSRQARWPGSACSPPFAIAAGEWHSPQAARVCPGGRWRPVAAGAGHPGPRRAVLLHGRVDPLGGVAAHAVAPGGVEAALVGQEVVAGEAVQRLHPLHAHGVAGVAPLALLRHRLEAVHAGRVAAHAGDALLLVVEPVPLRLAHLRPARIVGEVALLAGADLDLGVLAARPLPGQERARAWRRPAAASSGGSAGRRRSCGCRSSRARTRGWTGGRSRRAAGPRPRSA